MWSTVENRRTGPVGDRPRELLIEKKNRYSQTSSARETGERDKLRAREAGLEEKPWHHWKPERARAGRRPRRLPPRPVRSVGSSRAPRRGAQAASFPPLCLCVSFSLTSFFFLLFWAYIVHKYLVLFCRVSFQRTTCSSSCTLFLKLKQPFGFGLLAVP